MTEVKKFDLEERLVKFAVQIISLAEMLDDSVAGKYMAGQLIRSGISPALNYGEAKSAESMSDFVHKMKVALKELRETYISLMIIQEKPLIKKKELLSQCIKECNELISIFVKSIQTAIKNKEKK